MGAIAALVLMGASACGDDGPDPVSEDGRLVATAAAAPAVVNAGQSFTVELTLTNRTSSAVTIPSTDGCRLGFDVRTASGAPVVTPQYVCVGPIDSLTLARGAVLRESYVYQPGSTGFPRLEAGRYQLVPSVALRDPAGVLLRPGALQVR
jgi:hypothetical protein